MSYRRIRKMAAPVFAAVTLAFFFTACGGGSRQSTAQGATVEERMRNTTYQVKFFFPGWDNQADQDMVFKAFNDKLTELGYPGLSIRLDGLDWGAWSERGNAIVLSGGDYDLAYSPDWASYYADAMGGGAWAHWDTYIDLIPEFANYLAPYRQYLYVWGVDPNAKHIYRIPNIKEYASYLCEARWNKTVADKLGITEQLLNVKTLRELEPFLDLYRDTYGSNGMAVMTTDTNTVANAFMLNGNPFAYTFNPATDSYETGAFSPWFDEYIQLRRDWYARGYIPDYQQTDGWDDLVTKFGPESFLVYFNVGKPGGDAELNQGSMQRYGFEWGTTFLTPAFMDFGALMGVPWGLNARSGNPEAAAFLFELLSTNRELTNLINFGIQGTHYNLDGEGIVNFVQPMRYYSGLLWMLGNRFLCHRLPGEPANLGQLYRDFNDNAVRFANFGYSGPSEAEWGNVNQDMYWGVSSALWDQYGRTIQVGTISDADITDIRNRLNQANHQAVADVMTNSYRTWKASN